MIFTNFATTCQIRLIDSLFREMPDEADRQITQENQPWQGKRELGTTPLYDGYFVLDEYSEVFLSSCENVPPLTSHYLAVAAPADRGNPTLNLIYSLYFVPLR